MLTRYKDENTRRVIVDLSYGGNEAVNSHTELGSYEGTPCVVTLPTIVHVLHQVLKSEDPYLIKVDISRAFRNIRIDPGDAMKCGVQHQGGYYVDKSLVFGAINGTNIFQCVSDAIRYILAQENRHIYNYIDDMFQANTKEGADSTFHRLCDLIKELGLPSIPKKLYLPQKSLP